MYNSIVVTNQRNCKKRGVYYKFTLILDKINWQTTASLKILDQEYISVYPAEIFNKVMLKLSAVMQLPYDPEEKIYEGPELKIVTSDMNSNKIWSNVTNMNCDKQFVPTKNIKHQEIYEGTLSFLTKLSEVIFEDQINNN